MKQKEKIISISYILVFLLVTIVLGFASLVKLVNFYVNDVTDYNEWTAELGSQLETDIATSFYEKFEFVNLNGAIRNFLNQKEMNGVVKLNNGYLLTTCGYVPDESLQRIADALIEVDGYLDSQGISFLYVITPYTSSKYDPQLPAGVEDYGNDNLDRLASMLNIGDVDLIDIRETLHEDGIDQYDMMYRTDHHWTPLCGFYAYNKINERLMERMDCEVDPKIMDLSNYTITTYENWHLGSRGQRTGAYFAGIDDFDLIIPNFETSLIRNGTEGSYENLIINMSPLQSRDQQSRYTYDTVYGDALLNYINEDSLNDKKLLVVSDSLGKVVNPFLILSYREVRYVYRNLSTLSYEDIEEYQPDAVIMFTHVGSALNPDYYNFGLPTE